MFNPDDLFKELTGAHQAEQDEAADAAMAQRLMSQYRAFEAAGFTREQAMDLVKTFYTSVIGGALFKGMLGR